MAIFDQRSRRIKCKIVYFGPENGGKTSNVQALRQVLEAHVRTDLYNMAINGERALFMELNLPHLMGPQNTPLDFCLYALPGVQLKPQTVPMVLHGADGVVFVVDPQPEKQVQNQEHLLKFEI
jgi:signal recognition particle receptor subunit beta